MGGGRVCALGNLRLWVLSVLTMFLRPVDRQHLFIWAAMAKWYGVCWNMDGSMIVLPFFRSECESGAILGSYY